MRSFWLATVCLLAVCLLATTAGCPQPGVPTDDDNGDDVDGWVPGDGDGDGDADGDDDVDGDGDGDADADGDGDGDSDDGGNDDDRLNNQGGANVITVALKVLNDDIAGLNPDEWQLIFDNFDTLGTFFGVDPTAVTVPPMTDEEAQAWVDLLAANGVETTQDLVGELIPAMVLGLAEIPEELESWVRQFLVAMAA